MPEYTERIREPHRKRKYRVRPKKCLQHWPSLLSITPLCDFTGKELFQKNNIFI